MVEGSVCVALHEGHQRSHGFHQFDKGNSQSKKLAQKIGKLFTEIVALNFSALSNIAKNYIWIFGFCGNLYHKNNNKNTTL